MSLEIKFVSSEKIHKADERSAEDFYPADVLKECRQNKNTYLLWYQGQQCYYWLPRENSRKLYRVDQGGMFNSIDDLEEKKYLLNKIRRIKNKQRIM